MKRITSTLLLTALPALGLATNLAFGPATAGTTQQRGFQQDGTQEEGGQQEGDEQDLDANPPPEGFDSDPRVTNDIFGRRTTVRGNTFADRLRGAWQLTSMSIPGSNAQGRVAQGFMHIGDSFMSLELHALWEGGNGNGVPENDLHTTFTAEFQVDSGGKMFCSTIIGSYIDEETGELRWERAGYEREYRLQESRGQLELTFVDPETGPGQMKFRPFAPRTLGSKDIFGRNEIGSFGATDIYGRPVAAQRGERDIFGRDTPAEEEDVPLTPEEAEAQRNLEKKRRELGLPAKGPGVGGSAPLSGRGGF